MTAGSMVWNGDVDKRVFFSGTFSAAVFPQDEPFPRSHYRRPRLRFNPAIPDADFATHEQKKGGGKYRRPRFKQSKSQRKSRLQPKFLRSAEILAFNRRVWRIIRACAGGRVPRTPCARMRARRNESHVRQGKCRPAYPVAQLSPCPQLPL